VDAWTIFLGPALSSRCTCEKDILSCTSTIERQLTDWREQVTTWRDLHGVLYSHSDIVYLLIQSNCIELQPSINIFMGCVTFRSLCIKLKLWVYLCLFVCSLISRERMHRFAKTWHTCSFRREDYRDLGHKPDICVGFESQWSVGFRDNFFLWYSPIRSNDQACGKISGDKNRQKM
jgi:hypothetical protein